MATSLSPAESLVLLNPSGATAREAIKVTLLWLLAQGLLRIEETVEKKRFRGTQKSVYVRPTPRKAIRLPPEAASLMDEVQAAQAKSGLIGDVVAQARKAYGANLERFKSRFIIPSLVSRGLVTRERFLLVFHRWIPTPDGLAEQSRIKSDMERARSIPALLETDPVEAAAIALAGGAAILLVAELRPHYRQLSEAMRLHPPYEGYDDGGAVQWPSEGSGVGLASTDAGSVNFDAAGTRRVRCRWI